MFSVDLSIRECDGYVVVALRGELDLVDAADVTAELVTAAAREPTIIVDLSALEFIDARGAAALACGRAHARQAGGDLLLAAPRRLVRRVFSIAGLADDFPIHASVEEAAGRAGRSPLGGQAHAAAAGQDALAVYRRAAWNAGLRERRTAVGRGRREWRKRRSPSRSRTAEPVTVLDGPAFHPAARDVVWRGPAAGSPSVAGG